jgi:hypothetical protein
LPSLSSSPLDYEKLGQRVTTQALIFKTNTTAQESMLNWRFTRASNPIFRYDFKVGNYLPDDMKKMNPHLLMTIKDVTMGIRKSSWFFSTEYQQLLQALFSTQLLYFSNHMLDSSSRSRFAGIVSDLNSMFTLDGFNSVNINPTGGFYNVFILLGTSSHLFNNRIFAVNALDQKFYRMFTTASLQQRIFAN